MQEADAPVALGLSGGGDSVALLHLAADWAKARGRRLLALTVDHRLNPVSGDWTRFAGEVARSNGADWQALSWVEARGGAGVTARARAARHGMLAQAARQAGACVLMLAHTRDDVAETQMMRAQGSNLGQLREWSPSPVWPEGRGVMLFRPLLGEERQPLRDYLRARGQGWIEDPANQDMTYGRARARAALAGQGLDEVEPSVQAAVTALELGDQAWAGVYQLPRDIGGRALAYGLVCAGGGDRPPRGDRLEALQARLLAGEDFTASLVGARLEAEGDVVRLMREPGEFARQGLGWSALRPDQPEIWDGRFEISVKQAGWQLGPAGGRLSQLEPKTRLRISCLPPAARSSLPVLENRSTNQVVLAHDAGCVYGLGPLRLSMSLGEKTQERDLVASVHSAMAVTDLFSLKDYDQRAS